MNASRWAGAAIGHVAPRCSGPPLDRSLRVTLNFHPDRYSGARTVIERLADEGVYRSQFETGTSNGALTARPGGARWRWEQRMFDGAYDDAPPSERPKYGALNHHHRSLGAAPRFGSSHLRLAEHVLDRTTFCFPDSVFEPSDFAIAEHFDLFRLTQAFDRRTVDDRIEAEEGGVLDDYVEAQVHGEVRLTRDAEALVLDPSFRGTPVEANAWRLGLPVEWHEGRYLDVSELEIHPQFRGPHVVDVGRRIAIDGELDAHVIGIASREGRADPQDLKLLWHHVARFGRPTPQR